MQISTRRQLPRILATINAFRQQEAAIPEMDMLKGYLSWSDEWVCDPDDPIADLIHNALTWLWQYRMTLLTGTAPPNPSWLDEARAFWETCRRDAPGWPGFSAERCTPSPDIESLIHRLNKASDREARSFLRHRNAPGGAKPGGAS